MLLRYRETLNKIPLAIARPLSRMNISPNFVTFLAIPLAIISAFFISIQNFPFALLFFILSAFMDAIDGNIARLQKKSGHFGDYFDAVVDKSVEGIILLGFAFIAPIPAFIALFGILLIGFAKPRLAIVIPLDNHDWPGIGDHGDRLIVLFISFIVLSFFTVWNGFNLISTFLYLVALISFIGFFQRVFYAKKLINQFESKHGKNPKRNR